MNYGIKVYLDVLKNIIQNFYKKIMYGKEKGVKFNMVSLAE